MRWAFITDLHANRQAFEAVLADARAQGATRFALLGDFVGYGADPLACLDTIEGLLANEKFAKALSFIRKVPAGAALLADSVSVVCDPRNVLPFRAQPPR